MVFYATTALHFMEKSSLKSPIVQYAVCFDPSYIVKNQDKSIRGFGLLLQRLLSLKRLPPSKYVEETKETICTWSHGESSIERGFSINKEHHVENLQEESLITLCIVNDHMLVNNLTPSNIQISKAI